MAIRSLCCSYLGVETYIVDVEVDISKGIPSFNIVGMGDTAILESKERIRSSFKNINTEFPMRKILVNLSPADIKKKGSHFDLAILVGILANIEIILKWDKLDNYIILGEVSLNGKLKGVKGAINAAILAKEEGIKGVIVPVENYNEAKLINGIEVVPIDEIQEIIDFFNDEISVEELYNKRKEILEVDIIKEENDIDFSEVKGQYLAKRAMEIAAAGGHNIFLIGDPGSGKSMLSKRFTTILPEMTEKEIIETTKIYSISGILSREEPIITKRPFRSPHHTATQVSLVGGSNSVGEITLALNGVFFLDELGEFGLKTLETLRQPLEDGKITISRANSIVTYPVKTITILASNPTPSGFFKEDPLCTDNIRDIKNYEKRFNGPLIDRIDLYVEMKRLKQDEIFTDVVNETSKEIRERVKKARKIQYERYGENKLNFQMTGKMIKEHCKLDEETIEILKSAMETLKLSVRMYDKILKVSRTIADLAGEKNIKTEHIMEALNYRKKY